METSEFTHPINEPKNTILPVLTISTLTGPTMNRGTETLEPQKLTKA